MADFQSSGSYNLPALPLTLCSLNLRCSIVGFVSMVFKFVLEEGPLFEFWDRKYSFLYHSDVFH